MRAIGARPGRASASTHRMLNVLYVSALTNVLRVLSIQTPRTPP